MAPHGHGGREGYIKRLFNFSVQIFLNFEMKGYVTEWKGIRTKLERYLKNNNNLIALTKKNSAPKKIESLRDDFLGTNGWGQ
jgi:hypothetical protein